MLLGEIFSGLQFVSDTTQTEPDLGLGRRLEDSEVDLAGLIQIEVERGSEISAPYSMLGFKVLIKDFDDKNI